MMNRRMHSSVNMKYPFLSELGLSDKVNPGVFHTGSFHAGTGQVYQSVNPHNDEVIGLTAFGAKSDYDKCVDAMHSEKVKWM